MRFGGIAGFDTTYHLCGGVHTCAQKKPPVTARRPLSYGNQRRLSFGSCLVKCRRVLGQQQERDARKGLTDSAGGCDVASCWCATVLRICLPTTYLSGQLSEARKGRPRKPRSQSAPPRGRTKA